MKLDVDMTTEKVPCFNIDGIIGDTDGGCKTNYLGNVQDCLRKCFNFDCIGITETWIKPEESIDNYNMTDYTFLSKPRMEKRGGGVGMYIANRLTFKERNDINTNSENCLYE